MGDILFLAHRVPYPPDRGDKIRGFHIATYLATHRRVHMIAFAEDARDLATTDRVAGLWGSASLVRRTKSRVLAAAQALIARKPVSLTAFDNAGVHAAVEHVLAEQDIETIYLFSSQMAQYLPATSKQRVIMDFVDMDSAKFAAYARDSTGAVGWLMGREARTLFAHERRVAKKADASLLVSEAEAALFRDETGADNVHAIENGIDTDLFDPDASFDAIDATGPLIVFTGQMDYRPNIEGVIWFADAIMPAILKRHPTACFAIVGREPSEAVAALGRRPNIIVTGEVPDVRGWLAAATVVVAPLKVARGVQNKVLEAMAMARPVVASAAAGEGIDHADTIRVCESAGDIAFAVSALLDNPSAGDALGRAARERVQVRYGWAARLAPLDALLGFDRVATQERSAA